MTATEPGGEPDQSGAEEYQRAGLRNSRGLFKPSTTCRHARVHDVDVSHGVRRTLAGGVDRGREAEEAELRCGVEADRQEQLTRLGVKAGPGDGAVHAIVDRHVQASGAIAGMGAASGVVFAFLSKLSRPQPPTASPHTPPPSTSNTPLLRGAPNMVT